MGSGRVWAPPSPPPTDKGKFPRVPNSHLHFPRSSPTPSPVGGYDIATATAPTEVLPPTLTDSLSINSVDDIKLAGGVIFPPRIGKVEDSRRTPLSTLTACSILLCIHSSAQMRTAKNYRVAVFRRDPQGGTTTDKELFQEFQRTYNVELRSFWQRLFSLKGLKYIGVVEYTQPESPALLLLDTASRNSILYAFKKPHKLSTTGDWVDWVFNIKSLPPHRYGLEFVQGWNGRKIVLLAAVPWIGSVITAVLWSGLTGDVQTAMAIASYILTASGGILALLGIISTLEG